MFMAAKAPAKKEKKKARSKGDSYSTDGGKISRTKPVCPKCGPGVFMAAHKDRVSCGKCGYTEFSKKD
jgi:small subunit ribosomal protein S27Ae